jgi:DNA primase
LCFDGDQAGEEATTSAIEVLKEIGITPKVIRLEENLDPDEYILKYGETSFKTKVENPESSIEFLMKLHKSNKNLKDLNDISKYIDESIKELINTEDTVLVELTLKKISTEFGVEYDTLKSKYTNLIKENNKNRIIKKNDIKIKAKYNKYGQASRNLLYYMTKDQAVISFVEEKITYFPDDNIRMLANEIIYFYHKYGIFNIADFISYVSSKDELLKILNEIINMDLKEKYSKEEIEDYIKVINSYPINKKTEELNRKLKEEKDPIKQASILMEILTLKGVKE